MSSSNVLLFITKQWPPKLNDFMFYMISSSKFEGKVYIGVIGDTFSRGKLERAPLKKVEEVIWIDPYPETMVKIKEKPTHLFACNDEAMFTMYYLKKNVFKDTKTTCFYSQPLEEKSASIGSNFDENLVFSMIAHEQFRRENILHVKRVLPPFDVFPIRQRQSKNWFEIAFEYGENCTELIEEFVKEVVRLEYLHSSVYITMRIICWDVKSAENIQKMTIEKGYTSLVCIETNPSIKSLCHVFSTVSGFIASPERMTPFDLMTWQAISAGVPVIMFSSSSIYKDLGSFLPIKEYPFIVGPNETLGEIIEKLYNQRKEALKHALEWKKRIVRLI